MKVTFPMALRMVLARCYTTMVTLMKANGRTIPFGEEASSSLRAVTFTKVISSMVNSKVMAKCFSQGLEPIKVALTAVISKVLVVLSTSMALSTMETGKITRNMAKANLLNKTATLSTMVIGKMTKSTVEELSFRRGFALSRAFGTMTTW